MENGTRERPGVNVLMALARALRVDSTDELTGYDPAALPPEEEPPGPADAALGKRLDRVESAVLNIEQTMSRLLEVSIADRESLAQSREAAPAEQPPKRAAASARKAAGRRRK
jgi:hypothetical protein